MKNARNHFIRLAATAGLLALSAVAALCLLGCGNDSGPTAPPTYYTLKIDTSPLGGGTVSRRPDSLSYAAGARVVLTAVAGVGYKFITWSGASNSVNDTITVTMNTDLALTANFLPLPDLADGRDGKAYKTVIIGGKTWMARNLNYRPSSGNSWCYDDDDSNCDVYGRLYDWETATGVCPIGWHLPSRPEWRDLLIAAGGFEVNLKAKSGWNDFRGGSGNGTDDYGFSALPGGYRGFESYGYSFYYHIGNVGGYWTATTVESDEDRAVVMGISNSSTVGIGNLNGGGNGSFSDRRNGFSVRCVQN